MRKRIGIVSLVIAAGILGWSLGDRRRDYDQLMKQEYVAPYYARIGVIDGKSKIPIEFGARWSEDVHPFVKGSGPTKTIKHLDLSQSLVIVGRYFKDGLAVEIFADGHLPQKIILEPQGSGSYTMSDETLTVTLEPIQGAEDGNPH